MKISRNKRRQLHGKNVKVKMTSVAHTEHRYRCEQRGEFRCAFAWGEWCSPVAVLTGSHGRRDSDFRHDFLAEGDRRLFVPANWPRSTPKSSRLGLRKKGGKKPRRLGNGAVISSTVPNFSYLIRSFFFTILNFLELIHELEWVWGETFGGSVGTLFAHYTATTLTNNVETLIKKPQIRQRSQCPPEIRPENRIGSHRIGQRGLQTLPDGGQRHWGHRHHHTDSSLIDAVHQPVLPRTSSPLPTQIVSWTSAHLGTSKIQTKNGHRAPGHPKGQELVELCVDGRPGIGRDEAAADPIHGDASDGCHHFHGSDPGDGSGEEKIGHGLVFDVPDHGDEGVEAIGAVWQAEGGEHAAQCSEIGAVRAVFSDIGVSKLE